MPLLRLLALVLFAMVAAPAAAQSAGSDLAVLARDVERVESLRAIKDLQRRYAQYAQFGMWNEIGALFAPNAQFTFDGQIRQGQTATGPAQIAAFLRTRYGGGHDGIAFGDTRLFMIDTPLVTLAPNGREATGRWSVLIFVGGINRAAIEGGIFVNDYRRADDGQWRIAGERYFPQYSGPYETGWTNWGGGDLPIVPYHFTPQDAGVAVMAPEGPAPATRVTLPELEARIRALNDEDTVRNLQSALGYYVDRKMWDDVVDMFTDDATVVVGGLGNYRGKAGVAQWVGQAWGWPGLSHGQLNDHPQFDVTVTVNGNDAWVRGVELGMLGEADEEKGWWEGAVFLNRFRKDGGIWRVVEVHRFPMFRADYDLGWGNDLGHRPETAPTVAFPDMARGAATGGAIGWTRAEARTALQRSLAYDSIENVSAAYQAYLDDFKSDAFSALLARDGFKMSAFAGYYVGRDRVAEAGRRVWGPEPQTRPGISFHWRVQPVILVSEDGRSANMRVRLFQPRTGTEVGGPGQFYGAYFYSGMYHDQFVLEDGQWRMWNLSLDEPYMSNVAWKTGWARAKDPATPPTGATSVLVRDDSDFRPDVPVKDLGARQLHFRGGTGDPWQWPTILPMWFEYRNPVSGRTPEFYQDTCAPCVARPDLRLDHHDYQEPTHWPQVPER